ncbi:hypothetical protein HAX54_049135, partial [Datura stramonium]|nr:hypothetical protein [Datura stramonium]
FIYFGYSSRMVESSVDDKRKSEDETGAWRWRTGGRMTSESVTTLDGWTAGPSHLSPGGWRAEPRRLERPRGQTET